MRFYDVDQGEICLENTDIRKLRRAEVRSSYGMVLQDTWLRSGTVRDNIRMGRPEATEEEVVEAAKKAHAHSFIRRLPKGMIPSSVRTEEISLRDRNSFCALPG